MNPIALWSNIEDYGDWCYQYRIPNKSEFIEGFKYEFREFSMTIGKFNPIIYKINWHEYTVGNNKDHKHVEKFLNSYLEAGYIRIKKANEREEQVINQNNQMNKLFYYEAWKENKKRYIVIPAKNQIDGWNKILGTVLSPNIKAGKFKSISESTKSFDVINELEINGEKGYKLISAGHEITEPLKISPSEIIYYMCTEKDFEKVWPIMPKIKPDIKVFSRLFIKITKPIIKLIKGKQVKIKDKTVECIKIKIVPKHLTIIKTKSNERNLGKNMGWLPIIRPICKQQEKSENRLVCIATKDRKEFKRISFKDANFKISGIGPDGKEWEYISKKEYRTLCRPKALTSFTPALGDKKWKSRKKIIPNKSSSKINKTNRISKHHLQGIKHPKQFHTYEVSFERHFKSGEVEYIYPQIAQNEQIAINRATNKLIKEDSSIEYSRKHGIVKLAYFKPTIKRLVESSTKHQLKKDSLTTKLIMPKVLDLPIRKDKIGKEIPWYREITRLSTKEEKAKDKTIFVKDKEKVKTYTKYEVSYHRHDQSPFKKNSKKWRCPIPEYKTIRYNDRKKKEIKHPHFISFKSNNRKIK